MSRWGREDDDRDAKDRSSSARGRSPRDRSLTDDELLAAARHYREQDRFEGYLVKERGIERDSKPFKEAVDRWKVERARTLEEHRVRRRGTVDPDAQRQAREKALELILAARRSETREDFEKFLAERYGVTGDSPDYETFVTAWATYKREREGGI
jgi:hypothetical protein